MRRTNTLPLLSSVLTSGTLVFALACGGASEPAAEPLPPEQQEPITDEDFEDGDTGSLQSGRNPEQDAGEEEEQDPNGN